MHVQNSQKRCLENIDSSFSLEFETFDILAAEGKNNISWTFLSDNIFTNFLCFNFRFIGKNCAAVIVVISVKSKLVMTLDEFGIQECVCADVPWLLCNNVQPIMFLTSLTAASKFSTFKF